MQQISELQQKVRVVIRKPMFFLELGSKIYSIILGTKLDVKFAD
jgi:hypothetical protein